MNNLAYYTASRQGDGTYKIQGNIKNHKYMYGTYNVLAYVTDNYGQETWRFIPVKSCREIHGQSVFPSEIINQKVNIMYRWEFRMEPAILHG